MTNLFSIPDKEAHAQRYMVYVLTVLWTVAVCVIVAIGYGYFPHLWGRWTAMIGGSLAIALICLSVNHAGPPRVASVALVALLWLLMTVPCYTAGGIFAPGILHQMSVILTAGFLLGGRGGMAVGAFTLGADYVFVYLEMHGYLPKPVVPHTPFSRWLVSFIAFGTLLALQYYATNHLRTALRALQRQIKQREAAERVVAQTLLDLQERVKELNTLYAVSRILQDEELAIQDLIRTIAEVLPGGWQYPEITAVHISLGELAYATRNYMPSQNCLRAATKTKRGTSLTLEVAYPEPTGAAGDVSFLLQERSLLGALAEMIKTNLEWRERRTELTDYRHALDAGSMVSIADAKGCLTFVNENLCARNQYTATELLGTDQNLLWAGLQDPAHQEAFTQARQQGNPYRGELCSTAKDGQMYWVDAVIVPFVDENGRVYQTLSISYDITARKQAADKLKESEHLLRKITSRSPGNSYMFEIEEDGRTALLFINRGTDIFNHAYDLDTLQAHPELLREVLHEEDKDRFNEVMKAAGRSGAPISFQYRIVVDQAIRWRWMQAVPEINKAGNTIWYGATSDITPLVDYLTAIEQMIFDVGHVLRRPVSNLLGLSALITKRELSGEEIKQFSHYYHTISLEMDRFIGELNTAYEQKRKSTEFHFDVHPLLDKRDSLFR
ncbi:hypothetical protein GCM10028822_31680 [Hymenobacter terrigena]